MLLGVTRLCAIGVRYLAAAFVTVRALIREARTRYRWDTRPTTRRLK